MRITDGVNQNVNLFYKGSAIILIFSGMCLFGGARTAYWLKIAMQCGIYKKSKKKTNILDE